MFTKFRIRDYDFKLVFMILALAVIGVMVIGSAEPSLQTRQLAGVVAGAALMIIISFFNYSWIIRLNWLMYILNLALLLAVKYLGDDGGGAQRWLELGGLRFQPSETAKILLILFFAQFIMKYKDKINSVRILLLSVILLAIPLSLVYLEPDLSTSIMIILTFCVMLFVGGLSYKFIGAVLAILVPTVVAFFTIILRPGGEELLPEGFRYQIGRILAWLQPEKYADSTAYQQLNSITAIGSGQLYGKGLDNNVIASVKNGNFISEPQTDFIFAVIGEELGFLGSFSVVLLIFLIVWECLRIARNAKDTAGSIIASGMAGLIGLQAFLNIAVATGLAPNTGIPLPFVSAGLTSLIVLYGGIGIVLNIGLQHKKY